MVIKATPEQYAERLISGITNAGEKVRAGIERVTENPMEKAAAKKDKWLKGIQEAAAAGKWEKGLKRVSLDEWKNMFLEKGLPNMATGAQAARGKMVEFAREFLPFLERVQAKVNGMPDVTLDQRLQRMMTNARDIAGFKRS